MAWQILLALEERKGQSDRDRDWSGSGLPSFIHRNLKKQPPTQRGPLADIVNHEKTFLTRCRSTNASGGHHTVLRQGQGPGKDPHVVWSTTPLQRKSRAPHSATGPRPETVHTYMWANPALNGIYQNETLFAHTRPSQIRIFLKSIAGAAAAAVAPMLNALPQRDSMMPHCCPHEAS